MKVSLFVLCSLAVVAFVHAYPAAEEVENVENVQNYEVIPVAVDGLNNDEIIRQKRQYGYGTMII